MLEDQLRAAGEQRKAKPTAVTFDLQAKGRPGGSGVTSQSNSLLILISAGSYPDTSQAGCDLEGTERTEGTERPGDPDGADLSQLAQH